MSEIGEFGPRTPEELSSFIEVQPVANDTQDGLLQHFEQGVYYSYSDLVPDLEKRAINLTLRKFFKK